MREALKTLIEKAADLTASIEGTTDQFEDEVSALTDAASAAEKPLRATGDAACSPDTEYDRLCLDPPKTRKGRAWLAGFLIRNGRACTRAYDDCFENGDGDQVLALLMREVRADPDMRDEETPAPDPLEIGEAERVAGFRAATCDMAGAAARWRERAAKGHERR